jgi:hypothetical protein
MNEYRRIALTAILHTALDFGKHKGQTWDWVIRHDLGYIHWLANNQSIETLIAKAICELFPLATPDDDLEPARAHHDEGDLDVLSWCEEFLAWWGTAYRTVHSAGYTYETGVDEEAVFEMRLLSGIRRDIDQAKRYAAAFLFDASIPQPKLKNLCAWIRAQRSTDSPNPDTEV